ncbi:MAG: hypothetical protein IT430_15985 [Phycisphaerales bacterium]|nr:hypothetical protein [Phycisphaerales bacterium]
MRFTDTAVHQAFKMHHDVYAVQRGWGIDYHVGCWNMAHRAFENSQFEEFKPLYDELRRHWQVFRNSSGPPWTARQTFDHLESQNQQIRKLTLQDLNDDHLNSVWSVIQSMSGIKPTQSPTVVAVSKFLHFWNPRLFVIVDDAIMWQRVLSRSWLRASIELEQNCITSLLKDPKCPRNDLWCDLLMYLAVLVWASHLMRRNPEVTRHFAEYVRKCEGVRPIDFPIQTYEAAAVEWLLLGLAEIPPPGIELRND